MLKKIDKFMQKWTLPVSLLHGYAFIYCSIISKSLFTICFTTNLRDKVKNHVRIHMRNPEFRYIFVVPIGVQHFVKKVLYAFFKEVGSLFGTSHISINWLTKIPDLMNILGYTRFFESFEPALSFEDTVRFEYPKLDANYRQVLDPSLISYYLDLLLKRFGFLTKFPALVQNSDLRADKVHLVTFSTLLRGLDSEVDMKSGKVCLLAPWSPGERFIFLYTHKLSNSIFTISFTTNMLQTYMRRKRMDLIDPDYSFIFVIPNGMQYFIKTLLFDFFKKSSYSSSNPIYISTSWLDKIPKLMSVLGYTHFFTSIQLALLFEKNNSHLKGIANYKKNLDDELYKDCLNLLLEENKN